MTLRDYLATQNLTFADFGAKFAPPISEHTVKKWVRGERIPRAEAAVRIKELTGGAVTADDFAEQRVA